MSAGFGVIDAIGVVSGVLGIIGFGINNFKTDPEPGSTIKVAVALDGGSGTDNAGGDLPDVYVWNNQGEMVGQTTDNGGVADGNLGEIVVEHENQGVYTLFAAGNDAICVAWATTTWSAERGGNQYAVSGDFGKQCGAPWYYSNMFPSSDSDYQPACFWIDANGDQPNTGFQVYWPAFAGDKLDGSDKDPAQMCDGVRFGLFTDPDPQTISTQPTSKRSLQNKRGVSRAETAAASATAASRLRARAPWTADELVVSDDKGHSAESLCKSDSSVGPDFVQSNEGLFCDMASKTLYNTCGKGASKPCFDVDSHSLVGNNGTNIHRRGLDYGRVRDWRSSNMM